MRFPAGLTRGGYVEGFVPYGGRLTTETDLDWLPHGKRAAILDETGKRVGLEVEVDPMADGLWMAAQLDKSSRYREFVEQLLRAGRLSLAALTMPQIASKAYGIVEQPLVGWDLVPLVQAGGTYAVAAADIARRFEQIGTPLPQATWAFLDAQIKQETAAERNEK